MQVQVNQKSDNKQTATDRLSLKQENEAGSLPFADNRPEALVQQKLKSAADNSPNGEKLAQLKSLSDNRADEKQFPVQQQKNETGLPDNLKTGMENLSGQSLDDVKVHYNSAKPAQLQAHAYAQGTDIHVASGQEKHLPHEAWHVVQQKQGRVKPTLQMKGKVNVNDDSGLEKEADVMGERALQMHADKSSPEDNSNTSSQVVTQLKPVIQMESESELETGLDSELEKLLPEENKETEKAVVQGKWFDTRHAQGDLVSTWIDDVPENLSEIWHHISDISLFPGENRVIKLVYQSKKGANQFLFNGKACRLIHYDGEVKDGYPSGEFPAIQNVFDTIIELWKGYNEAEHVDASEGDDEGVETLAPHDLEVGSEYLVINHDTGEEYALTLDSKENGKLAFKSWFKNIEIAEEELDNYQIIDYTDPTFEEGFFINQEHKGKTVLPKSVINENIYGYNMAEVLGPSIENGDIVLQGKFIAPPVYKAPAYSSAIIQAPIGGGGTPAGNPPGWKGGKHPYHHNRGHLIGKQFGGIGGLKNIVTLTDGSNHPQMSKYENQLAGIITGNPGKVYAYQVTAHYMGGWGVKNSVGAGGGQKTIVGPPAPHHVTLDAKQVGGGVLLGGTVTINNGILQNHNACVD